MEFDDNEEKKIIEQINIILYKYERKNNHKKITKTKLYETLLAEKVVPPGSKEAFDSLYNYAVETNQISERGIKKFKPKKGTKAYSFTKEQIVKLFEAIDRPKVAIACYLTLICGLRISECCKLRLRDINLESCEVTIRDGKNSRRKYQAGAGKDRIIKFHSEFKAPIEKWVEIIGNTSEWFMPSMTRPDQHMRKKSLHEQYRIYLNKAGLLVPEYAIEITQNNHGKRKTFKVHRHRYYFHTLRHTYAQLWRDNGGDRDTLQKQLGHSDPETTQKYYDTTEEAIQNDVERVFGKADFPIKNSTIRPPVNQEPINTQELELAKLDYEKKKLELEIMKQQVKMMEVKNGGER